MLSIIKKRLLVMGIAMPLLLESGLAMALTTNSQLQSPLPLGTTTYNSTKTALQSFTDNWTFDQIASSQPTSTYLKVTLPTATNLTFSSMYLFDTTADPGLTNPSLWTTLWTYSTSAPTFWRTVNPSDNFLIQLNGTTTASLSQYQGQVTAAVPEAPVSVLMLIGLVGVTTAVGLRQRRQRKDFGPKQYHRLTASAPST